jgi:hypothetical protein
MEREETRITQPMVKHSDNNHYIINSASLSNPELHRQVALLPIEQTNPRDWIACVRGGFAVWSNVPDELLYNDSEDEADDVIVPPAQA